MQVPPARFTPPCPQPQPWPQPPPPARPPPSCPRSAAGSRGRQLVSSGRADALFTMVGCVVHYGVGCVASPTAPPGGHQLCGAPSQPPTYPPRCCCAQTCDPAEVAHAPHRGSHRRRRPWATRLRRHISAQPCASNCRPHPCPASAPLAQSPPRQSAPSSSPPRRGTPFGTPPPALQTDQHVRWRLISARPASKAQLFAGCVLPAPWLASLAKLTCKGRRARQQRKMQRG